MKRLFITAAGLALIFASTFILIKVTGVLSVDDIKSFLTSADEIAPIYVIGAVVALLLADLFVAVPTLTITILSGYFLGFALGFVAAVVGLLSAGLLGYLISFAYGPGLLRKIHKDMDEQAEMEAVFAKYGHIVLLICRALPILPEVSCCLAGATRMSFRRFIMAFVLGTVPYALIATYAGSQSTLENPKPAIFAAIGLALFFGVAWTLLKRRYHHDRKRASANN